VVFTIQSTAKGFSLTGYGIEKELFLRLENENRTVLFTNYITLNTVIPSQNDQGQKQLPITKNTPTAGYSIFGTSFPDITTLRLWAG